jgi:hypothetical protein
MLFEHVHRRIPIRKESLARCLKAIASTHIVTDTAFPTEYLSFRTHASSQSYAPIAPIIDMDGTEVPQMPDIGDICDLLIGSVLLLELPVLRIYFFYRNVICLRLAC